MSRVRRLVRGLTLLAAAAAVVVLAAVGQGFATADEAWFLQVVERVRGGDLPYRDCYFNVTPLSLYLVRAFAALTGNELLTLRMVTLTSFALTAWLGSTLAGRLGLGGPARALVALGTLAFSVQPATPYTPLAMVFFAGCFLASLRAPAAPASWFRWAGAWAGLAFAAKQNVGLLALLAVGGSLLAVERGRGRLRAALGAIGGFAGTAVFCLLPVVAQGGGPRLLQYGFVGKTTYLEVAGVPYVSALWRLGAALGDPFDLPSLGRAWYEAAFLLPPLVFVGLLVAVVKGGDRRVDGTVVSFTLAAWAVAFPRFGSSHLGFAIPFLLVGAGHAWHRLARLLPPRLVRAAVALASLWIGVGAGARLVVWGARIGADGWAFSELPHFRAVVVRPQEVARLRDQRDTVSRLGANRPALILARNSGLFYLTASLHNPTPYDYPYRSVLGPQGEAELVARIEDRSLTRVIVFEEPPDQQSPLRVERAVRDRMREAERVGGIALFVAR